MAIIKPQKVLRLRRFKYIILNYYNTYYNIDVRILYFYMQIVTEITDN